MFSEGIADYGGNIGAPSDKRYGDWEDWSGDSGRRGKIEGYVASLFHDLIDYSKEPGDQTSYRPYYVMTVFKTCRVTISGRLRWRNDVSDFVWCLENRVDADEHEDRFPTLASLRPAARPSQRPNRATGTPSTFAQPGSTT